MANNYFQFKQFTVQQGPGMLKVSTDSCIFGAWVAERMSQEPGVGSRETATTSRDAEPRTPNHEPQTPNPEPRITNYELRTTNSELNCLDIGAGTGLLMLMLAQQWAGRVDGIEIEEKAYNQALENIQASPWPDRLRLFQGDMKSFVFPAAYDLIISNPPFYEGDLTSPVHHKNMAKHAAGLTLDTLFEAAGRAATPLAPLALLLPFHRADYCRQAAARQGWQASHQLLVRQTPAHDYFRAAVWFEREYTGETHTETMVVHSAAQAYSERMAQLLKPYYLYL